MMMSGHHSNPSAIRAAASLVSYYYGIRPAETD
jgi:hypothetical protein